MNHFLRFAAVLLVALLCTWLTNAALRQPGLGDCGLSELSPNPVIGEPLALHFEFISLLPPQELPAFDRLPEGLLCAHQATTHLAGIHWHGFRWRQTVTVIPATLAVIPATTVTLQQQPLSFPELRPQLPTDLPEEPAMPHIPSTASSFLSPFEYALASVFIAGVLLYCWRRHRNRPCQRLKRLAPTPEALEQLPGLLAELQLTRPSQPHLFSQLDALRFAPNPPDAHAVQQLLDTVRSTLAST